MKVTALIPDQLMNDVKSLSKGETITKSLVIALEEWVRINKIKKLNSTLERTPLKFSKYYSSGKVRSTNRKA